MKNKPVKFLLKTLLFVIPVLAIFEVLFRLGFYPVITNSSLFDSKAMSIQKQHIKKLKVMAMGSSITLYGLNSQIMVQNFGTSYYNFGSWSLQMSDMKRVLNYYSERYDPQYVIMCSSITEFVFPSNPSYLKYLNASPFIKDHLPEYFYFGSFNSIHQIFWRKLRSNTPATDQYGGTSLTIPNPQKNLRNWNRQNIIPTANTEQNYKDMDTLCTMLRSRHIQLIFMQSPIKGSYANIGWQKQILLGHFDRCKRIVESHGGIYLNYYRPEVFPDSLFSDQCHLQASGGVALTKLAVQDLKKIIK